LLRPADPRPTIPRNHINLIRRISSDHPEWGEDRIGLEPRAKLRVEHASSTIRRFMATRKREGSPRSTTWRTFRAGHSNELWTMDLTTQPLWDYSMRDVLVIMGLRSRRVVHVAVTASLELFRSPFSRPSMDQSYVVMPPPAEADPSWAQRVPFGRLLILWTRMWDSGLGLGEY